MASPSFLWEAFIGCHWTPMEFRDMLISRNGMARADGLPQLTPAEEIYNIVDSVFRDTDYWWTDTEVRRGLREDFEGYDPDDISRRIYGFYSRGVLLGM